MSMPEFKKFAVDYWLVDEPSGDPDRSDFSDDLESLRRIAPLQQHFDGSRFGSCKFYQRIGYHKRDQTNWREIDP